MKGPDEMSNILNDERSAEKKNMRVQPSQVNAYCEESEDESASTTSNEDASLGVQQAHGVLPVICT